MSDIIDFSWPISPVGYRMEVVVKESRFNSLRKHMPELLADYPEEEDYRFVTDGISMDEGYTPERWTRPLKTFSGILHRRFAEIDPKSSESILDFARGFGRLGGDLAQELTLPGSETSGPVRCWGEDELAWIKEIRSMKRATGLWDMAQKGDEDSLGRIVRWSEGFGAVSAKWPEDSNMPIASPNNREELFELLKPGEVIRPAMMAVQKIINDHLWTPRRVSERVFFHPKKNTLVTLWKPESLIGAIWHDFAMAIEGGNTYRKCEQCGAVFIVPPKGSRKEFCSNACRTKAWRASQKGNANG